MASDAADHGKRFGEYSPELGLLLWAVWNPIAFDVPLNEYENYVPGVWKLLAEGAAVEQIAGHLDSLASEQIGVGSGGGLKAAERLKAWWYWRFVFPAELDGASR